MSFQNLSRAVIVGCLALALGVPASGLHAQSLPPAEIQRRIELARLEREALEAEQRRLERELAEVNMESRSIGAAVKSLDSTRRKIANDIRITSSKITTANLNIRKLENSVEEKGTQIVIHERAIASAIRGLYEHDTKSLVSNLLASKYISDVWEDRATLSDLTGRLDREISALRQTRVALSMEKVESEKTKEELARLARELGGQKSVVEESKSAKERLLVQTKNKEAEYQKMLAENKRRQAESEADLFRMESELKILLDPSLIPGARRGILAWPLDYVYITQQFGRTSGSARLYASGTHNGVDFRAPMGTPVKAMLSGVVEGAGNTDDQRGCYSYGRWILVRHPNGLSSVYSHLSASVVSRGQTVETGQVIGYSGGTPGTDGAGYSTGPHLHVGLFASQGVEVRQFVTSRGCKQVYVPIAKGVGAYLDPLAYLPAFQ